MKTLAFILIFVSLNAFAADPHSFDILITGKTQAGPHPNEEAAIRKIVAGAVENLKVKKYLLRTKPANGGFRVCIDPSADGGYEYLLGELNTIAIRESIFEPKLIDRCR